jgi:parvulin-like peptidyl-prolyl isomerase
MNFFRRHKRVIFVVTIVAFLGVIFFSAVSSLFSKSSDFAVKVNGVTVPMDLFSSIYTNSVISYQQAANRSLDEKELNEDKARIIQTLIQTELLYQEAAKYGIVVTDEELNLDLQNSLEFKDSDTFSVNKYKSFLNAIKIRPKDYESLRRKQLVANKVKMVMASSIKLWSYEIELANRQTPSVSREELFFTKVNLVLTDWYISEIKNSKIISNNLIFKTA